MVEDVDVVVVDGAVAEDVDVVAEDVDDVEVVELDMVVVVMGVVVLEVVLGLSWTRVGKIMDLLLFRLWLKARCRRIVLERRFQYRLHRYSPEGAKESLVRPFIVLTEIAAARRWKISSCFEIRAIAKFPNCLTFSGS